MASGSASSSSASSVAPSINHAVVAELPLALKGPSEKDPRIDGVRDLVVYEHEDGSGSDGGERDREILVDCPADCNVVVLKEDLFAMKRVFTKKPTKRTVLDTLAQRTVMSFGEKVAHTCHMYANHPALLWECRMYEEKMRRTEKRAIHARTEKHRRALWKAQGKALPKRKPRARRAVVVKREPREQGEAVVVNDADQ